MVFAVNPGADGSANSFMNFQNAALAIGKQLQAEASSTASTATTLGTSAPPEIVVTVTVTVEASAPTTVYSPYLGSPAATPAPLTGNVHTVQVGPNSTLTYNPSFVMAQSGDIIQMVL